MKWPVFLGCKTLDRLTVMSLMSIRSPRAVLRDGPSKQSRRFRPSSSQVVHDLSLKTKVLHDPAGCVQVIYIQKETNPLVRIIL